MLVTEIYIYFVSVEFPTHVHLIESWIITSNNNNNDRPPKLKILWTSDRRTKNMISNLFLTSKNETTNSPIHEYRVLKNVSKMFFKVINKK